MDRIIGQDRAIGVIRAALHGGRMHHAWIFHGPFGVGKSTTARALARILLCHDPQAAESDGGDAGASGPIACGGCESCRLIDSPDAAHPDLHLIAKELAQYSDDPNVRQRKLTQIPVDILRTHLIDPAHRSTQLDRGKVFIVEEAELLNPTGQNALLKTLEEPPAGTYLILITSQEHRLLPTIRSRCQRVAFAPLADEQVERWLEGREEATELSEQQRRWVVRFARGSVGLALLAARYRLDRWYERVEPMADQVAAGKPSDEMGQAMAGLVDEFAKQWVDDHAGASKDAANKSAVRHMLGLLGEVCRSRLHGAIERSGSLELAEAEGRAQPWLCGIDLIQDAERHLNTNVQPLLLLDNLSVQWAAQAGRIETPVHSERSEATPAPQSVR